MARWRPGPASFIATNAFAGWRCTGSIMPDALAALPIPQRLLSVTILLLCLLMAPHAANLSPAILGFFYVAAGWRFVAQSAPRLMPGRWLLMLLMITAIVLVVFVTGLYDGRLAGTALLVVMLGLKLLEVRARRDMHVTVFLGYFLVLTQFLYDQSLWLALYSFIGVSTLIGVQVGLNRVVVNPRLQLRSTMQLIAAAAPLALVVFLLFPRLHTPLWGINSGSAITGISGEMTMGNIGELSRSNAVAFRVRFFDKEPEPAARYWRGPVFWKTDGSRWTPGLRALRTVDTSDTDSLSLDYEITLEPTGEYWLFGLDVVTAHPLQTFVNSNYALIGENRVHRRYTYQASSAPDYRITDLSELQRINGLQLPDGVSERVRDLAEQWRAAADDDPLRMIEIGLRYFRDQPFVYTLTPGRLDGNAVDQFLFETRRGF
jgi:hypothetical protein